MPVRGLVSNSFRWISSLFKTTKRGESSSSGSKRNDQVVVDQEENIFDCEGCAVTKPLIESFTAMGCYHEYCSDCISNYVGAKLEEGVSQINCPTPNCQGLLELNYCRDIIPPHVFDRWGNLLCETVIRDCAKIYCPFEDCSALLLGDEEGYDVTVFECPSCWRLSCAKCQVAWHEGISCDELQKMIGEDGVAEEEEGNMFDCEVCADTKPLIESFTVKGCDHAYCFDCVRNYIEAKLEDGVPRINCPTPGCRGSLDPEYCREIIPLEVFDRWGNLLCESVIPASEKFYCPIKDCSALLIDDGGDTVTKFRCPSCGRLICVKCNVSWHEGMSCVKFQELNKDERERDDNMLRSLALNKKWQRCPKCRVYVERSAGCLYIKCRCGTAFCYKCGTINTNLKNHYCSNCRRTWD